MIKVAIVDDHKLFRQGLSVILASRENIEVVGKYESAVILLKFIENLEVDVILLDIDMPDLDGIAAAPQIFKLNKKVKIIILSMHLSSHKIQDAINANVQGYLLKSSDDNEVAQAIEDVFYGKEYFAKEVQEELIESDRRKEDPSYVELTPRELDILKLVCEEFSSQDIAEKLNISIHTADTHRRNLLSKTKCKNSIGLVKYAYDNSIFS